MLCKRVVFRLSWKVMQNLQNSRGASVCKSCPVVGLIVLA